MKRLSEIFLAAVLIGAAHAQTTLDLSSTRAHGILPTTKGGTGTNAADIAALKTYLGIGAAGAAAWGQVTGDISTQNDLVGLLGGKVALDGTGATGTWGIGVTGNAATATTAGGLAIPGVPELLWDAGNSRWDFSDATVTAGAFVSDSFVGGGQDITDIKPSALTGPGQVPVAALGTGTPSASTVLLGSGVWGIPATAREVRPAAANPLGGLVTFVFDDGRDTDYTAALPLFQSKGAVASSAIIVDKIGEAQYMTSSQIAALQTAGWEVLSHSTSHADFTGLTEAQARAEFSGSKASLQALGYTINNFVFPTNAENAALRRIAREYYRSAQGGANGVNPLVINMGEVLRYNIDNSTLLSLYEAQVDIAVAQNRWVVFYEHAIDAGDVTLLGSLIDYTQAAGARIVTVNQALDILGNPVDFGDSAAVGPLGVRGDGSGLTALNPANLSATVPATKGGAGTVNGILQANGSGTVTAVGLHGIADGLLTTNVPLLNTVNTFATAMTVAETFTITNASGNVKLWSNSGAPYLEALGTDKSIALKSTGSGGLNINYNNSATGSLTYWGGTAASKFAVTSAGAGTFAGSVTATAIKLSAPAPATQTSAGTAGEIRVGTSFIFVCTTTGADGAAHWKRIALDDTAW